ncbi:hypothetical protein [Niallia sp. RD1]|uniref:hypothetical protein n=1 Tax=Niallia sp. RD1 TaxID=2962858 RepID=UPI0020C1A25F|nr:hypothetical protein [Niallia sp. RD1]UTI44444.1 hypothetical protein NKG37_12950 [Niallia sp. RD1]
MPANNRDLKTANNGKIAPQYFDSEQDDYFIVEGEEGGAFYRERGSIAMEAWEGSSSTTKTFLSKRYGFSIINDGTADLTFTINEQTRRVKPGEGYNALFEPFTEVSISATSVYRAEVLR